jgi:hypothetical protein
MIILVARALLGSVELRYAAVGALADTGGWFSITFRFPYL